MRILLLFSVLLFFSCKPNAELLQKKKIQTIIYKEDCTVVLKKVKPSLNKTYFWYKSNEIHQSKGDYSGNLLQGKYVKHYITNELAEKGVFSYGLKKGEWKSWFKNGKLKAIDNWRDGKLSGKYFLHNDSGELVIKGKYSKGNKVGRWIDYVKKDTTLYKRGVVCVKKQKVKKDSITNAKASFLNRLFKKKEKTLQVKVTKKKRKTSTKQEVKKESFFTRIFKKKNDK